MIVLAHKNYLFSGGGGGEVWLFQRLTNLGRRRLSFWECKLYDLPINSAPSNFKVGRPIILLS